VLLRKRPVALGVAIADEEELSLPLSETALEPGELRDDPTAKAALRIPVDQEDPLPAEVLESDLRAAQVGEPERGHRRGDRKTSRATVRRARLRRGGMDLELFETEKHASLLPDELVHDRQERKNRNTHEAEQDLVPRIPKLLVGATSDSNGPSYFVTLKASTTIALALD
jgi:hypothetical protein